LNSAFADGDGGPVLTEHDAVHVGLAVATGAGLVVPVIHDADTRTVAEIAAERVRLVAAARDGALAPGELVGSTTTLSSLAGFRIDGFNAMVNPPHAAILAVGPARERPVARDGAVVVARTMTLTLTVDHRVVDGSESAAALAALADLLESDAALADLEER
jgi:pyruvate dehydrogenase E2 component (dihydrolipoamide acetyltransferase)